MDYSFHRQTLNVAARLLCLCLTVLGLAWVLYTSDKYAIALLLFVAVIIQFWSMISKLTIADREVIHFLDAVRFSDFSQKLGRKGIGGNQEDLALSFDKVMGKFKTDRTRKEKTTRYYRALVDHIPVALLSVREDGEASLLNNAAKKLFDLSHIKFISDLKPFGPALIKELQNLRAGKKRLIRIIQDDEEIKLSLATTKVIIDGAASYLVSLQNIQNELDTTQVEAWQDLVHVLTHELMNSLTPVASLSNSMNALITDITHKGEEEKISPDFADMLKDLRDGIGAISRRSSRLDSFVVNYRKMTKVPPPQYQNMEVATIFENMEHLFGEPCKAENITLMTDVSPPSLVMSADPELIDQAMINLIKNALEVIRGQEKARIDLKGYLDRSGSVIIEINDNGPGIDKDMQQRIFVPFFTTKQEGSGIGLSLARQVMLAHHGSISCHRNEEGGASFRLIFKG